MSSTNPNSAIFLTDSQEQIQTKINSHAFSGGGKTLEDHEKYGANLDVDIPYAYLTFFMEDDERLEQIRQEYGSGKMKTAEIKAELIGVLQKLVGELQERRKKITDQDVFDFMKVREIKVNIPPNKLQSDADSTKTKI
jgi:tryptophanyl-tRNA synthetase